MEYKKYLIVSVVREEIFEIISILESNNINSTNLSLLIPKKIYINNKEKLDAKGYDVYTINYGTSLLNKVLDVFLFFKYVYMIKPDVIFSGFSLLKYRLASKIFNIHHVAYIRGLMFDSSVYSGICDKLRYGRFKKLFQGYVFNTYEANFIITVSEINLNFLLERGIDNNKIKLISPPWLLKSELSFNGNQINRVIFVTQAFAEHGLDKYHLEQVSLIKNLLDYCIKEGIELLLRVHPRDYYDYSQLSSSNLLSLNYEVPELFIDSLTTSDLLVSFPSTFTFEAAYVKNMPILFISTPIFDEIYLNAYNKLNIRPIYCIDDLLSEYYYSNLDVFYVGESDELL